MPHASINETREPPLPPGRGGYVLIIHLGKRRKLRFGRARTAVLLPGYYLYFGSALSGLAPRIRRHLSTHRACHWHIDALTRISRPREVWWANGDARTECAWGQTAMRLPGAETPAPGFGSSDCRCRTHLVRFARRAEVDRLREVLVSEGFNIGVVST